MTLSERIGLDVGPAAGAVQSATAAAAAGAGIARLCFPLGTRTGPDESYLAEATAAVAAMRQAGLKVLAVVDGTLTVAPEGMGTFAENPPQALARAWAEELTANVRALAEAIGEQVSAWEILPAPNEGQPPRMAPGRWAALLAEVAAVIRSVAPWATIVSGSLVSDETDDGVDYLRQAYRLAASAGLWSPTAPPFDAVGLHLAILPDGGPSQEAVAAALAERARRLWRVPEQFEGTERARQRGIFITGLHWDAARIGEERQARNVWTAFDTLTADPIVCGVVWTSLCDTPTRRSGLYRGAEPSQEERRPSWQAFNDFALYARQISPLPPPEVIVPPPEQPPPQEEPVVTRDVEREVGRVAEEPVVEQPVEQPVVEQPAVARPEESAVAEPEERPAVSEQEVVFRLPDAAEVLRQQGYEGAQLERVLEAVRATYGDPEWLIPGEYRVSVDLDIPAGGTAYTNQQIISALYRVGGGTWALLERSGLVLAELTARREEPYSGPPLESLNLTPEELEAVRAELNRRPA